MMGFMNPEENPVLQDITDKLDNINSRLSDVITNNLMYERDKRKKDFDEIQKGISDLKVLMRQIAETQQRQLSAPPLPPPPKDNGVSFSLIAWVFAMSLLASAFAGWLNKPAPKIDYSERILFNQRYQEFGTSIGLFDSEEEAARKIENQRKYEENQKKTQSSQ